MPATVPHTIGMLGAGKPDRLGRSIKWLVYMSLSLAVLSGMPLTVSNAGSPDEPDGEVALRSARSDTTGASQSITSGRWTNLYPNLYDVSVLSPTEAWAAGAYGRLIRHTEGAWVILDPPALRGVDLEGIEMISPTNGWVVSENRAFQYDGATWVERSAGLGDARIKRLSAAGDNDVWAVVFGVSTPDDNRVFRWNGTSWVHPDVPVPPGEIVNDVVMRTPSDGWLVGERFAMHYDGATWVNLPPPNTSSRIMRYASAVPGELWVVTSANTRYLVYRYSLATGTWTEWQLTTGDTFPYDIYMQSSTEGWVITDRSIIRWDGSRWEVDYTDRGFSLGGISGVPGQVWAVGAADTVASRMADGQWSLQRGGPTTRHIEAVSMVSTNDVWAVGRSGTVLHYDGTNWQKIPVPFTNNLYDIQMLSASEGYLVGNGIIARWDGAAWTQVYAPDASLRGLHMLSSGEGWAVGLSGRIFRATGGSWSQVPSPTTRDLWTVFMDSPAHGWASGGRFTSGGPLIEYTGGAWVDRTSSLPTDWLFIRDMYFSSSAEGWAVGLAVIRGEPTVLRYTHGSWVGESSSMGELGYTALVPEALGELWAVGCNARHLVGGSWQAEELPIDLCSYGAAFAMGRGGWVVGPYGQIVRYNPLAPGQTFYDVPPTHAFYSYIECMASRGVIGGYSEDNTFRPGNDVTRGQLSKIVANSAGMGDPPGEQMFEDVPPTHPFYEWINRLARKGVMGGYECGGPGEPCGAGRLPYFRPGANATRGQISKIVSNAAGYADPPGPQIFEDVPPTNPFYEWIQRLASRGVMGGYECGGPGEPCISGRPYFRWGNNATRGQTSKIVANTFFPECGSSAKP